MKVQLNRGEFADAMGVISSVVPTRSTKPILRCTLLHALKDHCVLTAADQEVGIGVRMVLNQVEVGEEGRVLVAADKLAQIVRESTTDTLELEAAEFGSESDSVCHVRGKGAHFQIYCQDPNDFPPVAEMSKETSFELNAKELKRLSEWTVFAAAKESTRYAINGILWDKHGDALVMVATDGRRLARAVGTVRTEGTADIRAIVPAKAMHLFLRVMADEEEPIRVAIAETQIIVGSARATISAGLIEGKFPEYQEVIPADCDKEIELSTLELLGAVRQAALLTNEDSKGVRFALSQGDLTLSSRAPEQGEATVSLPVQYTGEPIDIGFNPVFMIEALRAVHDDTVRLKLKAPKRPGVLTVGEDLLHVVMPVNLS
ncbi:MAG: DNA polymerase III subunit beta [Phycisphaerae bacterium]|nr:DNA polymerase III subunit beta [Phycisphaerae bacterium]